MYLIISLFQLSVVGLQQERMEEAADVVMGEMATPVRPNIRPSRFQLAPAALTLNEELKAALRARGESPAISNLPSSPLVNLLVSFLQRQYSFLILYTFCNLNTVPYIT